MPRAVFPTGDRSTGPDVRLPLRSDVFLIAHDDDTGKRHIGRDRLCRGLAGAILLELWLAGRVNIGMRYHARHGRSAPETGVISIEDTSLVNDPLTDTAMTLLHRSGAMTARTFIDRFATPDLYERVRADMIATGILQRGVRRRFRLFKRRTYLAIDGSYSAPLWAGYTANSLTSSADSRTPPIRDVTTAINPRAPIIQTRTIRANIYY